MVHPANIATNHEYHTLIQPPKLPIVRMKDGMVRPPNTTSIRLRLSITHQAIRLETVLCTYSSKGLC